MVDVRTLAAAVLGIGLGVVCLAAPATIVRVQTAGRLPRDRHGEYGDDGVPTRWRRLVRVVGVGLVAGGAYFGWTLL